MQYALEVNGVSKKFKGFSLDDISFSLPQGYIMGLIGPNGAGKTTTIKLIMNLIMKNSGEIKVFGKDHIDYEVDIKSRIGFVYDNPNYYDHLNLKSLKKIIAPFYRTWDEEVFVRLVDRFELPRNKAIKKFSRGMVMKAAIAIALSHHADLIIMDEPTSGLDPVFRRSFLDMLAEFMEDEKKSVLFSTHITSDLERIADYVTFIAGGKIVFSAAKDEIQERYAIVKGEKKLINEQARELFTGVRLGQYGFEALTENKFVVQENMPKDIVLEKATLEDIMYYYDMENRNA